MTWLLVGIGGAIGSMARHGLNQLIHQRALSSTFPIGIFTINVLGSILVGAVGGIIASGRWSVPYDSRAFVIVGLLGGFTTFSSFSFDTLALARDGHFQQAAWNVVGQVVLSLVGVAAGYQGTLLALSPRP
jgi:fluoride exporter